jgi:hypothetical protein
MSDALANRFGQNNGAGMADELFLKVFGGEVLAAFETANVTLDKHRVRTITAGKSAQFPATGKVTAGYHTPGTEILGQTSPVSERVITIDDLLVSSVFLDSLDEAKSHFDVRSEYARQCGIALSAAWDKNVLQTGILAARAAATVNGGYGGTTLTSAASLYLTSATDLAAGIYAGVQAMDEKDIPEGDTRNVFVRPAQYFLLAQSKDLINRDWDGAGSYSDGKILRIGGAPIVKTNHLPRANVTDGLAKYQGDFAKTAALIMTNEAVGTVKLLDLNTEMARDIRRQGHLVVAKYAIGTGVLRPECSVELKVS